MLFLVVDLETGTVDARGGWGRVDALYRTGGPGTTNRGRGLRSREVAGVL